MKHLLAFLRNRRIDAMTSRQLYDLVSGPVASIIGDAKPIDADSGRVAPYSLNLGTSDVLGIILALRRQGYVIRKSWL